jgi:hypothetical protein
MRPAGRLRMNASPMGEAHAETMLEKDAKGRKTAI